MADKPKVLTFKRKKETTNKIVFSENAVEGKEVIGSLYVGKKAVEDLGIGDEVEVTIAAKGKK